MWSGGDSDDGRLGTDSPALVRVDVMIIYQSMFQKRRSSRWSHEGHLQPPAYEETKR